MITYSDTKKVPARNAFRMTPGGKAHHLLNYLYTDQVRMDTQDTIFSLEELCRLTGMMKRTVRFYMQRGLVDRPLGVKKSAYYTRHHLEQLLTILKWKEAGLSLERIGEIMGQEIPKDGVIPLSTRPRPGSIEIWSRIYLDDGVELAIEPSLAGLTSEQIRILGKSITELVKNMQSHGDA